MVRFDNNLQMPKTEPVSNTWQCTDIKKAFRLAARREEFLEMRNLHKRALALNINLEMEISMIEAASSGHYRTIWQLRLLGVKIDSRDQHGNTPLFYALKTEHQNCAQALLDMGASASRCLIWCAKQGNTKVLRNLIRVLGTKVKDIINRKGDDGGTALIWATRIKNLDAAKELVDAGADIDSSDHHSFTALQWAAELDSEQFVDMLQERGANTKWFDELYLQNTTASKSMLFRILSHAALGVKGNRELADWLLYYAVDNASRANLNILEGLVAIGFKPSQRDGIDALQKASRGGATACIKVLCESFGIDVNSRFDGGMTALMVAAECGRAEAITYLHTLGAELEAQDDDKLTPLAHAAKHGMETSIEVLNGLGAVAHIHKSIALLTAAKNGHAGVVRSLLQLRARPDDEDDGGATALMWASTFDHDSVVKALAEGGASLTCRDNNGRTVVSWAARGGSMRALQELWRLKADLCAADNNGQTAMMYAARWDHCDTVRELHRLGASPHPSDKHGQTVLTWAASSGSRETVCCVLELAKSENLTFPDVGTALLEAAAEGFAEVVKELLENPHLCEIQATEAAKAVRFAAANGHMDALLAICNTVKCTLDMREDDGATLLMFAARGGHTGLVRELVRLGADVNARDDSNLCAFLWALQGEHVETAKELRRLGSDIGELVLNAVLSEDNQRLSAWSSKCPQAFVDFDALVSPALLVAVKKSNIVALTELHKLGANFDARLVGNKTALTLALESCSEPLIQAIIQCGVDTELQVENGQTALLWAASHDLWSSVGILLLTCETTCDAVDDSGQTVLMYAAKAARHGIVEILCQKPSGIFYCCNEGKRALHFAMVAGNMRSISLLEAAETQTIESARTPEPVFEWICATDQGWKGYSELDTYCLEVAYMRWNTKRGGCKVVVLEGIHMVDLSTMTQRNLETKYECKVRRGWNSLFFLGQIGSSILKSNQENPQRGSANVQITRRCVCK